MKKKKKKTIKKEIMKSFPGHGFDITVGDGSIQIEANLGYVFGCIGRYHGWEN